MSKWEPRAAEINQHLKAFGFRAFWTMRGSKLYLTLRRIKEDESVKQLSAMTVRDAAIKEYYSYAIMTSGSRDSVTLRLPSIFEPLKD